MELRALSKLVEDPAKFRSTPPAVPTVWRMPAEPIASLLSFADADRILSHGGASPTWISVLHEGKRVPAEEYAWPSRRPLHGSALRTAAISERLGQGDTVVFELVHRLSGPLADLSRRLSFELGIVTSINAYLTPAGSQGFAHHHDNTSNMIVQTAGSKTWQVHEPLLADPLPHHWWAADTVSEADWDRLRNGTPVLDTVLRPGDVLWLPRGWIHNVYATDEPSIHLTIAFATETAHALIPQLLSQVEGVAELRRDLPWGVAREPERLRDAATEAVEQLAAAVKDLDWTAVSADLVERQRSSFKEPHRSPVAAVITAGMTAATPVVTVAEAAYTTDRRPDGRLKVQLVDTALTLAEPAATAVAALLADDSAERWCAADLAPAVAGSDAVDLVSRLLRAGLVRRADEPV